MWKSAGCALHLRKKHGKTSVRVRKTSVRVQYTYYQNTHTLQNPHKHRHYNPPPHIHTHTHTHIYIYIYILQNSIKPPQYKLKQTQFKIYPNEIVKSSFLSTLWLLSNVKKNYHCHSGFSYYSFLIALGTSVTGTKWS
jgi:hypothetical protein